MRTTYLVQTVGTTAVAGVFLASDVVARLLALHPASETLWYLQLEVMRPLLAVRMSDTMLAGTILGSNILWVSLSILAAAWLACLVRQRLMVGLMANLSLMLVAAMGYSHLLASGSGQTASLVVMSFDPSPDAVLLLCLGVLTGAACLACHVSFIRDAWTETTKTEKEAV
ncbi:hypothetical protein [Microvirga massiliensis]|uniref:hypothetical protein n=1 Tax=Microvirga massiliensis TaxID=1033741 RepID=UPI00062BECC0|nr:hypothetical protein [Microvirga massiliensis]